MTISLTHLFRQAEDYFFKSIAQKCLVLGDGATAYMTGVQVADLNFVYIYKTTNVLETILNQSKQFYDQDKLSFVVIIPEEFCTPEMKNIFKTMGYVQTGKTVAMAVQLEDLKVNRITNFDDGTVIRANDTLLKEWMIPLVGAFESTIDICSQYTNTHENALKKNCKLYHFSLYQPSPRLRSTSQERPITSITLSVHNQSARIDDLGTLPEFQGKGYATRLMNYALAEAKRLGAKNCFLEASDSGFSIYQKLGFKLLFKNNIYSYLESL